MFKLKNKIYFLFLLTSVTSFTAKDPSGIAPKEQPKTIEVSADISNDIKRKVFEEMLDLVRDQTKKLLFCCQQLEQVLASDKIRIEKREVKASIQSEIKEFKILFQNLVEDVLVQANIENILQGAFFNKIAIEYLTPHMKYDVTKISFNNFQLKIAEEFNKLEESSEINPELLITENEHKIAELIKLTDTVGLTEFNKWFRYLNDQPLPYVGTSAVKCAQGVTLGAASLACLYAITVYCLPKELNVPLLGKIKNWPGVTEQNKVFGLHTGSRVTSIDFEEKSMYSSPTTSEEQAANNISPAQLLNNNGILNKIEQGVRNFGGTIFPPFTAGVAMYLMNHFEPIYKTTMIKSKKMWKKFMNLCRGDIDRSSTEAFDTYTKNVSFSDIINGDHLEKLGKELVHYLKHPDRYERTKIFPSTGYLLTGPPQTGKSYFARALRTLINENFKESEQACRFIPVTSELLKQYTIEQIFSIARYHAPCILFIDELDLLGVSRNKDPHATSQLLTCMSGLESNSGSKKVIVIAATNRPEELDFALLQDGRFGTKIEFSYPCYEDRVKYLMRVLNKKGLILPEEYVDAMAQETEGCCYNTLDKLVSTALLQAMSETRTASLGDFETSLDREIRNINSTLNVSDAEKTIIATYQAGQAIAQETLATGQEVVKVTIYPVAKPVNVKEGLVIMQDHGPTKGENQQHLAKERVNPTRLGSVFTTKTRFSKDMISDEELHNEVLVLLAGQAALEIVTGNRYSNFGKEDRALALSILEQEIAQGTEVTAEIRQKAIEKKEILYKEIKESLKNHIDTINTVKDYLCKHYTIDRDTWKRLLSK